ncbi:TIGR01777 family oxidoreductase [Actinomycetes bacterium KLBMP 9797]
MKIAIAGASGFLGSHLVHRLTGTGHEVLRLVRRPAHGPGEIPWDPAAHRLDPGALAGVDAVVNLAGASVSGKRWTPEYKKLILQSRVDATSTLANALAATGSGILVNASGMNYYGDTGDRVADENAAYGRGFLAEVCIAWEAATRPAELAGVRVVRLRIGHVLHRSGGYLKPQLLPFKLGLGGPLGGGRQWMSWIALADWLSAVEFVLARDDVFGAVNTNAPEPVRNADFTKVFGQVLHRPVVMPVPAFGLRLLLGELSVEALGSVRMAPNALTRTGFHFQYPNLREALEAALLS